MKQECDFNRAERMEIVKTEVQEWFSHEFKTEKQRMFVQNRDESQEVPFASEILDLTHQSILT